MSMYDQCGSNVVYPSISLRDCPSVSLRDCPSIYVIVYVTRDGRSCCVRQGSPGRAFHCEAPTPPAGGAASLLQLACAFFVPSPTPAIPWPSSCTHKSSRCTRPPAALCSPLDAHPPALSHRVSRSPLARISGNPLRRLRSVDPSPKIPRAVQATNTNPPTTHRPDMASMEYESEQRGYDGESRCCPRDAGRAC